jgi:hypothetical protein
MLYVVDMYEKKEKHQEIREKIIPTMKLSLHTCSSTKHSHSVVLCTSMRVKNGEDIHINKVVAWDFSILSLNPELNFVSEVTFRGRYESIIQPYRIFRPISLADDFQIIITEFLAPHT